MAMDTVDYEIRGDEMQFVEIELDPDETAVGEAGSMMYMDAGIAMDTVFGGGAASQAGLFGKLLARASGSSPANPCSPPSTPSRRA